MLEIESRSEIEKDCALEIERGIGRERFLQSYGIISYKKARNEPGGTNDAYSSLAARWSLTSHSSTLSSWRQAGILYRVLWLSEFGGPFSTSEVWRSSAHFKSRSK